MWVFCEVTLSSLEVPRPASGGLGEGLAIIRPNIGRHKGPSCPVFLRASDVLSGRAW